MPSTDDTGSRKAYRVPRNRAMATMTSAGNVTRISADMIRIMLLLQQPTLDGDGEMGEVFSESLLWPTIQHLIIDITTRLAIIKYKL